MNAAGEVLQELGKRSNPAAREGMARFGIRADSALGIPVPVLRRMAREIGRNHSLALALWKTGVHEARILAGMVDEPAEVSERQMESWAADFNSWDLCDQCCSNLFDRTPHAYKKAAEWSRRKEEFVRRAGFALMACLAVHDRKAGDERFVRFLPLIKQQSVDGRNFVKKAVNWALRQIGKRNVRLNRLAIRAAEEILKLDSPSAKWIASDALRELGSGAVQGRLKA